LKKPNRVPIRQFVQRVQQLNGYLDLLPCLLYSECKSYMQLSAKIAKLEKSNKKLKRANKKYKHDYDSNSDDSDSS
jgi:hypothetical protein